VAGSLHVRRSDHHAFFLVPGPAGESRCSCCRGQRRRVTVSSIGAGRWCWCLAIATDTRVTARRPRRCAFVIALKGCPTRAYSRRHSYY
jgi:hypothetical protein